MPLHHDGPVELPNLSASLPFETYALNHQWAAYLAEADVPQLAGGVEGVDDGVHHYRQEGSGNAYA